MRHRSHRLLVVVAACVCAVGALLVWSRAPLTPAARPSAPVAVVPPVDEPADPELPATVDGAHSDVSTSLPSDASPAPADDAQSVPASAPENVPKRAPENASENVPENAPADTPADLPTTEEETRVFDLPEDAEYVPEVVLVSVPEGTSAQEAAARIADSDAAWAVDAATVTEVVSGLVEMQVAPGVSVADAVNSLLLSGAVKGAQPDYLYHTMEDKNIYNDLPLSYDELAEPATEQPAAPVEEPAQGVTQDEGEPAVSAEESPAKEMPDGTGEATETGAEQVPSERAGGATPEKVTDTDASASVSADDQDDKESAVDAASNDNKDSNTVDRDATATEQPDATTQVDDTTLAQELGLADYANDPYVSRQWALESIHAWEVWSAGIKGSNNLPSQPVGVAVIDSGFLVNHPDLKDNIAEGSAYNSHIAAEKGESAPGIDDVTPGSASLNHGSHVAGIISATTDNNLGIAGVAYNAKLVPIKAYTQYEENGKIVSGATSKSIYTGIQYAIKRANDYNIRVINMSMGLNASDNKMADPNSLAASTTNYDYLVLKAIDEARREEKDANGAVTRKGIVFVGAAGNRGNATNFPYNDWPADYASVVGVINLQNVPTADNLSSVSRADSSNYNAAGEKDKNIAAPGTGILSTMSATNASLSDGQGGSYGYLTGTSMAAPQVAGVLALMFAADPDLTADSAVRMLYNSATPITDKNRTGDKFDLEYGYGEVNARDAVAAVTGAELVGNAYLKVGDTATYTIARVDGEERNGWVFSLSNEGVLEVADSTNGTFTARKSGFATVIATKGNETRIKYVTVVGSITGSTVVPVGGNQALSIDNSAVTAWEWKSYNEDVATVTNTGIVHGVSAGTAKITATLVAVEGTNEAITLNTTVHVVGPVQVDGTAVAGNNVSLTAGETATLTIAGADIDALSGGCWVWSVPTGSEGILRLADDDSLTDSSITLAGISGGTVTATAAYFSAENTTNGKANNGAIPSASLNVSITVTDSIARATVDAVSSYTYNGSDIRPTPTVRLEYESGKTRILTASSDFTYEYLNNKNAGTATISLKGVGAFVGTTKVDAATFVIKRAAVNVPGSVTLTYNGSAQTGVPSSVAYELVSGAMSATNQGRYQAVLRPTANYQWSDESTADKTVSWTIQRASVTNASVSTIPAQTYTGRAITPRPTVVVGRRTLTLNTDYTLSYDGNTNANQTARVFITGKGNYQGSRTVTFSIARAVLTGTYAGGSMYVGGTPPTTVNVTGFVGGQSAGTAAGYRAPTVSVTNAQRNTPGTYSLTPSGGAADNYTFVYRAGSLKVMAVPTPSTPTTPATPAPATTVAVSAVSLSNAALTMRPGDTAQLAATVAPSNATDKSVQWASSNTGVATVGASGEVVAVRTGTATITATAGGRAATCEVTVVGAELARLAGANRYDTMASIVEAGFPSSGWAVIATGSNFPDALAASALAGARGCPVILTESGSLSGQASAQLQRLGVRSVYIMGGAGAISDSVEQAIQGMGISTQRVAGASRQATSIAALHAVRAAGSGSDTVIVATGNGFADTLSIGPWSYATHSPIVLTQGDGTLSGDAVAAIQGDGSIRRVVIVGGGAVVSDAVMSQLGGGYAYERLAGANRYETSAAIAGWEVSQGLSWTSCGVATGQNFPDALAGAALCGIQRGVLVLASSVGDSTMSALAAQQGSVARAYVLGGESAVPASLASYVQSLVG